MAVAASTAEHSFFSCHVINCPLSTLLFWKVVIACTACLFARRAELTFTCSVLRIWAASPGGPLSTESICQTIQFPKWQYYTPLIATVRAIACRERKLMTINNMLFPYSLGPKQKTVFLCRVLWAKPSKENTSCEVYNGLFSYVRTYDDVRRDLIWKRI